MAIDIIKNFEEIEFVRDSAVCQVKANDYITTAEVIPEIEYAVMGTNIPANSGMRFEVNGIAINWCSVNYTQDLADMQDDYYAYVGDIPTSLSFSIEVITARIVAALKNHPNYTEWSQYAWIDYRGDDVFHIKAKTSAFPIKKYTSFTDTISNGATVTYTDPVGSEIQEDYIGTINTTANPYVLNGMIGTWRGDFKLVVDVIVYIPGGNPSTISENYYTDKKGYAEIDVSGIVNRHFESGFFNFSGFTDERSLINVDVKISSFFNNAIQNNTSLNFKALNAYTGESDKSKHISTLKSYFEDDVKFLTKLPPTCVIKASEGQLFHIVLKREIELNTDTNVWNGWQDTTKLYFLVSYKTGAPNPFEIVNKDIGIWANTITKCYRFKLEKDFVQHLLLDGNWEDIDWIGLTMNYGGGMTAEDKKIYLDHKTTGDEQVFNFKNRFGVFEKMVAVNGITEGLEIEKLKAFPKKDWDSSSQNGNVIVYANESQRVGSASIGFLGKEYKEYLEDFLNSNEIYIFKNGEYVGITIEAGSFDLESSLENMKSLEFEYRFNEIKRS